MARYSPYSRSYGQGIVNKTPAYQTTALRGGSGGSGSSALLPQQDNTSSVLQNLGGLLGFMYLTRNKDKNKDSSAASAEEKKPEEDYVSIPPLGTLTEGYLGTGKMPQTKPIEADTVPATDSNGFGLGDFFNGSPNFFDWNYSGLWNSLFGGN